MGIAVAVSLSLIIVIYQSARPWPWQVTVECRCDGTWAVERCSACVPTCTRPSACASAGGCMDVVA
eukprot:9379337-Alexandrium_andersonii.AAC.1